MPLPLVPGRRQEHSSNDFMVSGVGVPGHTVDWYHQPAPMRGVRGFMNLCGVRGFMNL
jgi:hypothetical protein